MIVVLVIGTLLAIAVPNWMQARAKAHTNVCEATIKKIEEAKQRWIMENNLALDANPAYEDLVPDYLTAIPDTPADTKFILGDGNTRATGDGCVMETG
jgi:Tfp pilus assembly protein PilE